MLRKRAREWIEDDSSSSEEEGEFEEYDGTYKYHQDLSEYELARLQKIRENQEVFEKLGVVKAKSEVLADRNKGPSASVIKSRKIVPRIPQKWYNNESPFNIRKPDVMDMKIVNGKMGEAKLKTVIEGWLDGKEKMSTDTVKMDTNKADEKLDASLRLSEIEKSGTKHIGLSDVHRFHMYDDNLAVLTSNPSLVPLPNKTNHLPG